MNASFQRKRKKPRIDMVPLIDVLMVLIIFFLVTMQFQDLRALNVKLPKIDSAGSNLLRNELVVSIDSEGLIYLNGKRVEEKSIVELFELLEFSLFMEVKLFQLVKVECLLLMIKKSMKRLKF